MFAFKTKREKDAFETGIRVGCGLTRISKSKNGVKRKSHSISKRKNYYSPRSNYYSAVKKNDVSKSDIDLDKELIKILQDTDLDVYC